MEKGKKEKTSGGYTSLCYSNPQPGAEVFTLDDFRDDLSEALDAERGDVPDHDQMEVCRLQPVRQYARRSL